MVFTCIDFSLVFRIWTQEYEVEGVILVVELEVVNDESSQQVPSDEDGVW